MSGTAPVVSVVMSVYNGQNYLAQALESIAAQTFTDWECVVIDDCSTDDTPAILSEWAGRDSRFRMYRNGENLRLAKSLNRGVTLACGRYVVRMDGDDICLPRRLERQVDFMERQPELAVSACKFFKLQGDRLQPDACGQDGRPDAVAAAMLVGDPLLHPGVIARREEFLAFPYDPQFTCTEDMELWTRMLAAGKKFAVQDEYLMLYRLHDKQITATTIETQRREVREIYRRFFAGAIRPLSEEELDIWLGSIHFRDDISIEGYISFLSILRQGCGSAGHFLRRHVDGVMIGLAMQYKRQGVKSIELWRLLRGFSLLFLAGELMRQKIRYWGDLRISAEAARQMNWPRLDGGAGEIPTYQYSGLAAR